MTPKAPAFQASPWGCRSLLLTRQTYHVVERDHTCCYCGAVRVTIPLDVRAGLRVGWPLSGFLVQQ